MYLRRLILTMTSCLFISTPAFGQTQIGEFDIAEPSSTIIENGNCSVDTDTFIVHFPVLTSFVTKADFLESEQVFNSVSDALYNFFSDSHVLLDSPSIQADLVTQVQKMLREQRGLAKGKNKENGNGKALGKDKKVNNDDLTDEQILAQNRDQIYKKMRPEIKRVRKQLAEDLMY